MKGRRDWLHGTGMEVHLWTLVCAVVCEAVAVLFRWKGLAEFAGAMFIVSAFAAASAGDSFFTGMADEPSSQPRVAATSAAVLFLLGALLLGSGLSGGIGAPLAPPPSPGDSVPFPLPR